MFFPKFLNSIFAKSYLTAENIATAVNSARKSPEQIRKGDFVIVSQKSSDISGYITDVQLGQDGALYVHTAKNGVVKVAFNENFNLYVVKRMVTSKLGDHATYERSLQDAEQTALDEISESKNIKPVHSATKLDLRDHSAYERDLAKSQKSSPSNPKFCDPENVLPIHSNSSKLKLSFHEPLKHHTYAAGDFVRSLLGSPSQIVEILPETGDRTTMAILKGLDGKTMGAEFLDDLTPLNKTEVLRYLSGTK